MDTYLLWAIIVFAVAVIVGAFRVEIARCYPEEDLSENHIANVGQSMMLGLIWPAVLVVGGAVAVVAGVYWLLLKVVRFLLRKVRHAQSSSPTV